MKKKLAVVLSLMLVFAVVFCTACGGKTDGNGDTMETMVHSERSATESVRWVKELWTGWKM